MHDLTSSPGLLATIGLPFSGKSTLARALAQALSAELVELDAMTGDGIADPDDASAWIERYHLAHVRIRSALTRGEFVVFDAVNHRAHQRDRLRRLAAAAGTSARFVWLDVPAEVAPARLRRNWLSPTRQDVPEHGFSEIEDAFEPPDGETDVLVYDGLIPVARWVEDFADALLLRDDLRTDGGLAFRRC
ncbi:MAG: AAA family ATPase [Thermomicrobiales bacterium]